jgi:hypothetical protein
LGKIGKILVDITRWVVIILLTVTDWLRFEEIGWKFCEVQRVACHRKGLHFGGESETRPQKGWSFN